MCRWSAFRQYRDGRWARWTPLCLRRTQHCTSQPCSGWWSGYQAALCQRWEKRLGNHYEITLYSYSDLLLLTPLFRKVLVLEDQFTSPCPWTTKSLKIPIQSNPIYLWNKEKLPRTAFCKQFVMYDHVIKNSVTATVHEAGMLSLQRKNCVIHLTWLLQGWASHNGALYL